MLTNGTSTNPQPRASVAGGAANLVNFSFSLPALRAAA